MSHAYFVSRPSHTVRAVVSELSTMFAEASKRAAVARFKQRAVDAEGQEREVSGECAAGWCGHCM